MNEPMLRMLLPTWLRFATLTLAALWVGCSTASAQSPGDSIDSPDVTAYRRIFVPADTPYAWPTGAERYLPVATERFEKLLGRARDERARAATSARVSNAAYRGELVDDALLAGTVVYAIESPDDEPRVATLDPMNLAILSANWQGEVATPARWGLWKLGDGQRVSGVLAPGSGSLQIDWQLRAQPNDGGPLEFILQLPPAVPQTLELSLPVDYQAVLSSAELIRTGEELDGKRLWLFQLGSHGPHRLRLHRQAATTVPRTKLRLSQATEYRLRPDGLEVTSTFRFEPQQTSTGELRCSLPGILKVASVTLEGNPADWRWDKSKADRELLIHLPSSQKPRELRLRALATIRFDEPWQLPAIRPQGAGWTEGTSLVVVSPDLELRSLTAESATVEHIVGLQAETASMEAYRVQEWSDRASLEVVVSRRTPRLKVEVATAADLGSNETTARISARISCQNQPAYHISAEITAGWSIESVKAEPASALREWHVEGEGDQGVLHLQLNRAIQPDAPLAVEFDARAEQTGFLLPTTVGRLKILRFVDATEQRQLILLRSRRQGRMEFLHGLEQARITPEQLSPPELALLPNPLVGELVDSTHLPANQVVDLRPNRARYEATVAAEWQVMPQSSVHRYEVVCQSLGGPISEIAVQFDEPLPDTAEWTLLGSRTGLESRRLVMPEQENDAANDGAVYLLKLPYAATEEGRLSISYSAVYSALSEESTQFNSIRFPRAVRWSGQVALRGPLDGLRVEDSGWTPVGWDSTATGGNASLPLLGCYRWESNPTGRVRGDAPLMVHRTAVAAAETLVAWLAEYQSHQAADGAAIYSAVYYLENSGAAEVEIMLPEQTELQASWLDQQQLTPRNLQVADRTYRFRLTEGSRYPTLALQYVSRGPALGRATTVEPALPNCSFPVHLSRWTLWTPEQFVPDDLVTGYSARRLPWRQRLFGPLARPVGQEAFHPLRAGDWPQLWSAPVEGLRTRLRAERFAALLAMRIGNSGEQNWGQLLGGLVTEMGIEEIVSLDLSALRAAGIEARGRPGEATTLATSSIEQQARQLARHGLALVVSPSRIIVTTSDRVAHWREDLHPTATPRVYSVHSEHLLLEIETSPEQAEGEIVSVAQWTAAPAPTAPAWKDSFLSSMSDVGHRACTIEFVDQPPSVVVRRAYAQQAYWYVVWLATVVGGMWWLERRADRLILVLAVATAACMVAPPYWLTIPQAVLVGLLSAVALRIVSTYVTQGSQDQSTQAVMVRSTPLTLLACVILMTGEAVGALPTGQPAANHNLPSVLVPVDDAGELDGEDVYLPESFLAALKSAPSTLGPNDTRHVLLGATIRGSLQSSTQERAALADPWTISLKMECFEPHCEIFLPLRQTDAAWIDQLCKLDGKIVPLDWQPDGLGCQIKVLGAGMHHLELTLRPRFDTSTERSQLALHVPRMPGIRLELAVPPSAEDLHIVGAGKIQTDAAAGVWRTTLAVTEVLQLDWATAGRQPAPDFAQDVEHFSWLRVEQAVARLEVQFLFRGAAAPPRNLQLKVAPQLKLLPPDEHSPVEQIVTLWDKPGVVRLQLKPGLGPNARIPLKFQLQRTSSLGRFFFPSVRLEGVTPSRSLFAASLGSGLSYHEEGADTMRSISSSEFSSERGFSTESDDGGGSPLFAYSLDQDDPEWSLRVWPDPETFAAQQSMQLHCQTHGVLVEYEAAISQVVGRCLIHQLRTPTGLEIDEITVSEQPAGDLLPIRWSRPDASHVMVFLGRPTSRPHVLSLRGSVRPEPDGTVAAPRIVLQGADRGEILMDLYRDPRLLVDWMDPSVTPAEVREQNAVRSSAEILVGRYAWRADEPDGKRRLRLRENQRRFMADTVTTVNTAEQGHVANLFARVTVQEGVVGQLQFSVPANFQEPYKLQPPALGVVGQIVDTAEGRHVTMLLNQPVASGQVVKLQLSGQLISPAEGLLALPNLIVNDATGGRRYVMLPTKLGQRAMIWQTAELDREPLPEDLRQFVPSTTDQLPYRVVGRRFFAREPAYRGPLRNAALRQVWVDGVLDARGSLTATASFVVQPGRATHCSIRLPDGARLMQLVADDLPARREPLTDGVWRIPLGPPFLPRVIKVSYLIESQDLDARMRLTPPEVLIGDAALPCPPVDWRIRPVGGLRIRPTTLGNKTSRTAAADSRYRRLVEALEEAAPLAIELPTAEVAPWFRAWRAHVQSAGEQAGTWDTSAGEKAPFKTESLASEESTPWSELFEKVEISETAVAISPVSAYPPDLSRRPTSSLGTGIVYLISDSAGRLEIICTQMVAGSIWRWLAACAVLTTGVMLERRLRSMPERMSTLRRWPHALALGVGVVWWSLLTPSAVGLLIVVLALLSLTLRLWREYHPRQASNNSTQLTARVS